MNKSFNQLNYSFLESLDNIRYVIKYITAVYVGLSIPKSLIYLLLNLNYNSEPSAIKTKLRLYKREKYNNNSFDSINRISR